MSISKEDMLKLVKELRAKTDAGVKECKKVLTETEGDMEEAVKILRERGIAKAEGRSGRTTNEGVLGCYLHRDKIVGVVELSCETDFVARTDVFKDLAKNIAIHIVTSSPIALARENLDQDTLEKEKEIYRNQEKESGKPDNIIDKIVNGKIEKYIKDACLLEQPFYKDDNATIEGLIKEAIAKLGENITVKRFFRMQLGEE